MAQVYLSIGSNIEREKNIRGVLAALETHFGELLISKIYESEAVGFDGDNFYNLIVGFDTERSITDLCRQFHQLEEEFGRRREQQRFAARTMDIDLVLYGDEIYHQDGIEIPRDEITKYAFVLKPLAEVAPALMHPELGKTVADLWSSFDQSTQRLWPVEL